MKLLRTDSLGPRRKLEVTEFQGNVPEPYAIFSHTWEQQELLYADLGHPDICFKAGYQKIYYAMKQAQEDGYQYLWVDTCCIDKSSSAELSEAINSMYYWYQQAAVCYVYLCDVTMTEDNFKRSRWFTRGWTLQELLAPANVVFYSQSWELLGDKLSLAPIISSVTGIDTDFLSRERSHLEASIAKRMFWASARVTTRIEDMAYCLLGIFSVNMALLYGERERAFIRLQEEIIKVTDDQTIFAWQDLMVAEPGVKKGLLAEHPVCFSRSAQYVPCRDEHSEEPHSMNNGRVKVELRFPPNQENNLEKYGLLSCIDEADPDNLIGIRIELTSRNRGEYQRILCHELWPGISDSIPRSIYVPQNTTLSGLRPLLPRLPKISIFLRHLTQSQRYVATAKLRGCSTSAKTTREIEWPTKAPGKHINKATQGWVPIFMPTYFRVPSESFTPSVALNFSVSSSEVSVILGTRAVMEIACGAECTSYRQDLDQLKWHYAPKTSEMLLSFKVGTKDLVLTWSATRFRCPAVPDDICYKVDFNFKKNIGTTELAALKVEPAQFAVTSIQSTSG